MKSFTANDIRTFLEPKIQHNSPPDSGGQRHWYVPTDEPRSNISTFNMTLLVIGGALSLIGLVTSMGWVWDQLFG